MPSRHQLPPLLAGLDPDAPLAQRHLWLIRVVAWVRGEATDVRAARSSSASSHSGDTSKPARNSAILPATSASSTRSRRACSSHISSSSTCVPKTADWRVRSVYTSSIPQ